MLDTCWRAINVSVMHLQVLITIASADLFDQLPDPGCVVFSADKCGVGRMDYHQILHADRSDQVLLFRNDDIATRAMVDHALAR